MPLNKLLRKLWVESGYDPRMGSAAVVPPPPKGFSRAYHLTSAEYAISNISLSRIKISRFSDLNDPFELLALNLGEKSARAAVKQFRDKYNNRIGLLSFSGNWTNPVLWSHYGAKHGGICLGFDIKSSELQNVEYKDQRILQEIGDTGDPRKLSATLKKTLRYTKFKHWDYEEEKRVFIQLKKANLEGKLYFHPFGRGLMLREVILGPQCELSLLSVRDLVSRIHPDAVTFRARLAFKSFNVVPEEASVPPYPPARVSIIR